MMEEQVYTSAAQVEPKADSGSDVKGGLNFSTVKRRYSADAPTEKPKLPALQIAKAAAPNEGPLSSRGDAPASSKAPVREPAKSDAKQPVRPASAVPQSMKPKGTQGPLIGLSKRGHRKHVGNTVNLSGAPIPYFPPTVYGKISDMEARLPLSEIMGFTQYRNALRQFMEEHLCHENFDFLTIVDDFEQHALSIPKLKTGGPMAAELSALQSLYLDAKLIYDHYVHEGSEQQVNMSGQARTMVEKHMEQFAMLLKFRQQGTNASTLSLASISATDATAAAPAEAAALAAPAPDAPHLRQRRPSYAEVASNSISMSDLKDASGAPMLTFKLEHLFTNAKEIIWRMVENDAVKRFLESHAYLDMLSAALEDQFQPVFQFEGKTFENTSGYKSVHVDVLTGYNLGLKQVDAYVVLNVDGNSFRSKTVRSSKEPHWNQHFEFPVTNDTQALEMDVYDSALMGRGAYLGSVLVPLVSVQPEGADVWYQLLGRPRALPQHAGIQMKISLSKNAPSKAKKSVACLSFN